MKLTPLVYISAVSIFLCSLVSCSDSRTYAELLESEDHYVNNYLADHIVINSIPEDTVFKTVNEYGEDAPFYRLDEEGDIYMQVVNPGTPGNMVKEDELLYFRYTRYSLAYYEDGELKYGGGNEDDMGLANSYFRYGNMTLSSSTQWGSGIQRPLAFLPVDCQVNLVVKSQYGFTSETAEVKPYLFKLRYFRPKI